MFLYMTRPTMTLVVCVTRVDICFHTIPRLQQMAGLPIDYNPLEIFPLSEISLFRSSVSDPPQIF